MIDLVPVREERTLEDYALCPELRVAVRELEGSAAQAARRLEGRTIWMVNSTAHGGGVAEMMPMIVSLLRQLGVNTEWVVIKPHDTRFFDLTKRLHNLLHGAGEPNLSPDDRALYRSVSRHLAEEFRSQVAPEDVLVINDPQPLGMGAIIKKELGVEAIWRSHIGLDKETRATREAWEFLAPWLRAYDRTVFSLRDYVPSFLSGGAEIIYPTIDPLDYKNRELSVHELTGILTGAALAASAHPDLRPPLASPALRLQRDGSFAPATCPEDLGLLFRPIVTQISRWDNLKGFAPLLEGFSLLKERLSEHLSERHAVQRSEEGSPRSRRLDLARLVLAGPDPDGVQDDPEAQEVLAELSERWMRLSPDLQRDIAVIKLPMDSPEANALMVNGLQRCSSVVAQNSLQEGFGLTVTEAMWKARPVLGTRAAGIRSQVLDGEHGRLVSDAENPEAIAATLGEMLEQEEARRLWGRAARARVAESFLVFAQVRHWLEVLSHQSAAHRDKHRAA